MSKQAAVLKYYQRVDQLTTKEHAYRKCVDDLCEWFIKNDKVQRDTTTKLLFAKTPKEINAQIITKEAIVVAGVEEVAYLLQTFTDIHANIVVKDGGKATAGQTILELQGNPGEILAYERTMLNLMQRLSGIATGTNEIVSTIQRLGLDKPPLIASTRKTQWSLLDKKAVALGGGATHRLNLADGVLVKDNHLLILKELYNLETEPELVVKTFELFSESAKDMLIEIEVEKVASIEALIKASEKHTQNALAILLDNFSADEAQKELEALSKKYNLSRIIFEAAGGITKKTITEWAKTGVDVISLGALTHSPQAVDLSLEII